MAGRSDDLLDRLKRVECPDATYPARSPALVFERAVGSEIWDADGRRYIDLCAGFGVLALGHNHPSFLEVMRNRGDTIVHGMGDVYASRPKVELLELLTKTIAPGHLTRAALALSGAQAVELAVKTAMLATKKSGFLTLTDSYHGLDLGILPLTARADFRAPFTGWLREPAVVRVEPGCERQILAEAKAKLESAGHGAAALLVEPVQGRAGVRPMPPGWLALTRKFCDDEGILLIYDEVFTGLGRTGRLSYAEEVPCDLLCLGKALGGGLPLSACLGTEATLGAWPASTGEALHTGTFFGHPLSCELAAVTLRTILAERLSEHAARTGQQFLATLRERLQKYECVTEIRGEGLMLAVEFNRPGLGALAMDGLRRDGIIALASGSTGQSLSMTPALNIPPPLFFEALDRLEHFIHSQTQKS